MKVKLGKKNAFSKTMKTIFWHYQYFWKMCICF